MPGIENVIDRLFPLAEAGNAVVLADRVESVAPAGNQFVGIALMPGIEDQLVARSVEHVMQRQSQFHDAQVSAEMPPQQRDDLEDLISDASASALERKQLKKTDVDPEFIAQIQLIRQKIAEQINVSVNMSFVAGSKS